MCTNLMIKQSSEKVVSARTMDFGKKFQVSVVKVPRKDGALGYIAFRQLPTFVAELLKLTSDGMNEKGLSGALLWLPCTKYPENKGVPFSEFLDVVLANYESVNTLNNDIVNEKLRVTNKFSILDKITPTHFIFSDRNGESF